MTVSERIPFSGLLLPLQKGYTYVFASFNSIMVGVLMVAIAVYVCVGLPNMNPGQLVLADMFSSGTKLTTLGAGIAVLSSSLSGGTSISQIADDVKNPCRNIPLAILLAPVVVAVIYNSDGRRHARRDARGTADDALRGGQGLPAPGARHVLHRGRPALRRADVDGACDHDDLLADSGRGRDGAVPPPSPRRRTSTASPPWCWCS